MNIKKNIAYLSRATSLTSRMEVYLSKLICQFQSTIEPVYKRHIWELVKLSLLFTCSLYSGSNNMNKKNWGEILSSFKSRRPLHRDDLSGRFDCIYLGLIVAL